LKNPNQIKANEQSSNRNCAKKRMKIKIKIESRSASASRAKYLCIEVVEKPKYEGKKSINSSNLFN